MMKTKVLFYLCIIQSIIIIVLVLTIVPQKFTVTNTEVLNLREYVDSFDVDNNCLPDVGYIPDAETADAIGSAIIDKLTGNFLLGVSTVTYDEENRLWMVERGYLFSQGAFVVIEQDTGRIIKALLYK